MLKEKIIKFREYLFKDTVKEDESKGLMISLRLLTLSILCYLLMNGGLVFAYLFSESKNVELILIILVGIALYVVVFVSTYKANSIMVFHTFAIVTYFWIIMFIVFFGWNCGVQHFLVPIVILSFFSTYDKYLQKSLYTIVVVLFRLALYLYCGYNAPIIPTSEPMEIILQVINTVVVFFCIAIVCWFLSSNTQETEKKLFLYNQRLQQEVSTDPLTKLLNRRKMMSCLQESIERSYDNNFSIAIGDIDFFKKINDTWGHDCGDIVLQSLASIFREFMKGKGHVARWGGEEFLFLFENMNGDDAAECIQSFILEIRNYEIAYKEENIKVTMTFGLEEYDTLHGLNQTIKAADDKLYMGKKSGRNRLVY